MRARSLTLGAALSALGVALVFAWLGYRAAQLGEARLADLSARRATLEAASHDEHMRAEAADRKTAALAAQLKRIQARQAEASARRLTPQMRYRRILATNAAVRSAFLKSYRANLSMGYQMLYRRLNLSPEQIGKFEDLLVSREEDHLDLTATAVANRLPPTDSAVTTLSGQQDDQLHAAEAQLLGSDGYAQLQQYDRAVLPLEGFVADISTLAKSDSLTGEQTERLINDIASASGTYQGGGNADMMTVDWAQVINEAQAYLSTPQLAAVKAHSTTTPIANYLKQFFSQPAGSK